MHFAFDDGYEQVQPKDPYAAGGPDLTFDNQKPYTLTDLEVQQDQHAVRSLPISSNALPVIPN